MTGAPQDGPAGEGTVGAVRRLLDAALTAYQHDPAATARLTEQRARLDGPLRVALVGRVKAGKSTLLNALVGERLAPTDAGECTRVVTMYRHGAIPRLTLRNTGGGRRTLPVRRVDGALRLDLAGTPVDEVDSLVVDWPAPALVPVTLVDTPGLSSLTVEASERTHAFLGTGPRPPGADAVVFLTRQMQPDDLAALAAFQEQTGATRSHTTTITVLSRADEVGSGRLDSLVSAAAIAQRMGADPAVRAVSHAVVPVSGLLAMAARLLRQADFTALRSLAFAEPGDVETMLLTADRFLRADVPVPLSAAVRRSLLERVGLFGIRLSLVLLRSGVTDAASLAEELMRRSGLPELQRLLADQFTRRGAQVKAASALSAVESLLRQAPPAEAAGLWRALEQVRLEAHDLVELELLTRLRTPDDPLPPALRDEGERLLGAAGSEPEARLALPMGAGADRIRAVAADAVARWREVATDPLAGRGTADAADVIVRSCEALLAAASSGEARPGPGGGRQDQP
jgi:hypothetical protein